MDREKLGRRRLLRLSGASMATGLAASSAGCVGSLGAGGGGASEQFSDSIYSTNSSFATMTFLLAQQQNIYGDHDIDMEVEVTNFTEASRSIAADLTQINFTDLPSVSRGLSEGNEFYLLDRWVNLNNAIITRSDSDVEAVPDLEGKTLGVPFWGSGTTTSLGAMCQELYDFDIENDPAETVSSAPPVLWNLLADGEIDAMGQFLAFTLQAMGRDDLQEVFNPFEEWNRATDYPPSNGVVVADKSWVDENPEFALRWLEAYDESIAYHQNNSDEALSQYGRLIGLSEDDGTLDAASQLFDDGRVYADEWTADYVDSQHELMELLVDYDDELDHVPDREDRVLLREDLEALAE